MMNKLSKKPTDSLDHSGASVELVGSVGSVEFASPLPSRRKGAVMKEPSIVPIGKKECISWRKILDVLQTEAGDSICPKRTLLR